jgi:hypothetical protein
MMIGNEIPAGAARTAKVTTAEEYAGMVWRFVQVAGGLVKGLDGEVKSSFWSGWAAFRGWGLGLMRL